MVSNWKINYFLGFTILDLTGALAPILLATDLPLFLAFLICAPFNLNDAIPDLLVCAIFLPAILALACLFLCSCGGSTAWPSEMPVAGAMPLAEQTQASGAQVRAGS